MDSSEVNEKILDVLIEDITYFSDETGMEISLVPRDNYLIMVQEAIDETTRVYFSYIQDENAVIFEYKGKSYYYSSGLFKKSFARYVSDQIEREKAEKTELIDQLSIVQEKQINLSGLIKTLFGEEKQIDFSKIIKFLFGGEKQ